MSTVDANEGKRISMVIALKCFAEWLFEEEGFINAYFGSPRGGKATLRALASGTH